ncbi:MAG: hypothetical protein JWR50_3054 [Mucilaginibacter sp.]|nr:hypothetical protein [Mucilaginibacter sp.]
MKSTLTILGFLAIVFLISLLCKAQDNQKAITASFSSTTKNKSKFVKRDTTRLRITDSARAVQIEFDETGRMITSPPKVLTGNTQIRILVNTSEADLESRVIEVHNRYITTLNNLSKSDTIKKAYEVLNKMYLKGETPHILIGVLIDQYARQLLKMIDDKRYSTVLQKKLDVYNEGVKLKKLLVDTVGKRNAYRLNYNKFKIPDYDSLLKVTYLLHLRLTNMDGLLIGRNCDTTITLSIIKDKCCSISYKTVLAKVFLFREGPVKYDFELRRLDPVQSQAIQKS